MNITLAIYCESPSDFVKGYHLALTYHLYFHHVILVKNFESTDKTLFDSIPSLFILDLKTTISQGSALNKIIPQVITPKVLLIDANLSIDMQAISYINTLSQLLDCKYPYFIGFKSSDPTSKLHPQDRVGEKWCHDLSLVTTLTWGALFFEASHFHFCGGFSDRLSNDAMMIDFSWRAHKKEAFLLENSLHLGQLNKKYQAPCNAELYYIKDKYPLLYPNWWQRFSLCFFSQRLIDKTSLLN